MAFPLSIRAFSDPRVGDLNPRMHGSILARYELFINTIRFILSQSSIIFYFIPVFPEQYFFPLESDLVAVNGSSSTGRCSLFIRSSTRQTCLIPTSSVLFDGNVPTLNLLDGDMWASQLLTINTTANTAEITFDLLLHKIILGSGELRW